MSGEHFVVLVLCTGATVDDLIHERQKHRAVAIDILHYEKQVDYISYKEQKFADIKNNEVNLMFVFGKNDSVIVLEDEDIRRVENRLRSEAS